MKSKIKARITSQYDANNLRCIKKSNAEKSSVLKKNETPKEEFRFNKETLQKLAWYFNK